MEITFFESYFSFSLMIKFVGQCLFITYFYSLQFGSQEKLLDHSRGLVTYIWSKAQIIDLEEERSCMKVKRATFGSQG